MSARFICAEESFKESRLQVGGDPDAGVLYRNDVPRSFATGSDGDVASDRRKLDRVVDQVQDHSADQSLVCVYQQFIFRLQIEADVLRGGECSRGAHAFSKQFVQVELSLGQRIVARIGPRQGKKILHNLAYPPSFVAQDLQRLAILANGPLGLGKRHVGFASQNGNGSAELVRSVGHEPALLVHGVRETIEKLIERLRQHAEFVAFVDHRQTIVEVGRIDFGSLLAHRRYRRQSAARQEIASSAGEQNAERNDQRERVTDGLQKFFRLVEREQNGKCVLPLRCGETPHVSAKVPLTSSYIREALA